MPKKTGDRRRPPSIFQRIGRARGVRAGGDARIGRWMLAVRIHPSLPLELHPRPNTVEETAFSDLPDRAVHEPKNEHWDAEGGSFQLGRRRCDVGYSDRDKSGGSNGGGSLNRKRAGLGLLSLPALGLLISACGATGSTAATNSKAPTSTTPSTASPGKARATPTARVNYAKQYLADVGPADTADKTFQVALSAWGSAANPNPTQTQGFVTPFVSALQTLQGKLTAQTWSATDVGDVHAFIAAIAALQGDISGLPSLNILNESTWSTQFQRDAAVEESAANTVRHDLGLPPIPTTNG